MRNTPTAPSTASKDDKTDGDKEAEPKRQPIDLINNPTSNAYAHIHPFLVVGILYATFSFIVQDPVTWLTYLLTPLAGLQAIYIMLCVPVSYEAPTTNKTSQGQRRKQKSTSTTGVIASRLSPAILSILASLTITTPPIFILLVLHGAPITTHIPHTTLLAAHISLLACVPLFYAHGVDSNRWRSVYSLQAPVDEVMGAAIGTLVGSWLGAIPIPLDWDREWQKWPVTVVAGAYAGWAVGSRLGATLWIKGRVVEFD